MLPIVEGLNYSTMNSTENPGVARSVGVIRRDSMISFILPCVFTHICIDRDKQAINQKFPVKLGIYKKSIYLCSEFYFNIGRIYSD